MQKFWKSGEFEPLSKHKLNARDTIDKEAKVRIPKLSPPARVQTTMQTQENEYEMPPRKRFRYEIMAVEEIVEASNFEILGIGEELYESSHEEVFPIVVKRAFEIVKEWDDEKLENFFETEDDRNE